MYAVFDIGGTHARIGVSQSGKTLDAAETIPTPRGALRGIAVLAQRARALSDSVRKDGARFRGCAAGIAGILNRGRTALLDSPYLPGWTGLNVRRIFSRALGAPVTLENDAALAALAEATQGAGKGFSFVAYLTVSTGIGGARIVNGAIDRAAFGFEPGRQIIEERGRTLEALVSGSGFTRRFGRSPAAVADPRIWKECARLLALGVINVVALWSPDAVVLGGPMITGRPAIPLSRVRFHVRRTIRVPELVPVIRRSMLGDDRGLLGGLHLLTMRARESKN